MLNGLEYGVNGAPVRITLGMAYQVVPVIMRSGGYRLTQLGQGDVFEDHSPGQFWG